MRVLATMIMVCCGLAADCALARPGGGAQPPSELVVETAREVDVGVHVVDASGAGVPCLPVVADRFALTGGSPAPCAWTDARGRATLRLRVKAGTVRVPLGIAAVAPGCGAAPPIELTGASTQDWTQRLDRLMKTNAFPARAMAVIAEDARACEVRIVAQPAVRVLARVRHLRDRVLFYTPEREWSFNPMWQLFALAERVPTDQVILDGVPATSGSRIRLTSNAGTVSCVVDVPWERAIEADLDGTAGKSVDLGDVLLPQEIDRLPVNERITVLDKLGQVQPLLTGRTIALTLCSREHAGLLFHIDVIGQADDEPAHRAATRDQRAYLPQGTFLMVPTSALRTPEAMFAFFDHAQSDEAATTRFPTVRVDPSAGATGSDLVFDEGKAAAALKELLASKQLDP